MQWIKAFHINNIDVTKKFFFLISSWLLENTDSNDGCVLTADMAAVEYSMMLLKATIIVTGSVETKADIN